MISLLESLAFFTHCPIVELFDLLLHYSTLFDKIGDKEIQDSKDIASNYNNWTVDILGAYKFN